MHGRVVAHVNLVANNAGLAVAPEAAADRRAVFADNQFKAVAAQHGLQHRDRDVADE